MIFKLLSDAKMDVPFLVCEVCKERTLDLDNDKATGTPQRDGKVVDVVVHHAKCAATGTVSMSLRDFLKLFAVQHRLGDLGSDGKLDRIVLEVPTGRRFEK